MSKQVKSKKRVSDHGEVYTNEREVNAMLDLVKHETERIDSRFLEPACGNGNFLAEVLQRKLNVVNKRYRKSQIEWERNAVLAVSSIYGVDILEDNAKECRERLLNIFNNNYAKLFKDDTKDACHRSIKYLLGKNIIWGDALDFTNPKTKESLVFSEWSFINSEKIKRRDYMFRYLVEKKHQYSMFTSDEGNTVGIEEPIKEFPLKHFLKLGKT